MSVDLTDLRSVRDVAEDKSNPFTEATLRRWIFNNHRGFREECTIKVRGTRLLYLRVSRFSHWLEKNDENRTAG